MFARYVVLAVSSLLLAGCQTARFYSQAVAGQWEILHKRRSIDRVLASPDTSEHLRRQLTLVRQLCAFAQDELHLPAEHQYTYYADLQRPFVVWNIHAAPAFSLKAKSWWYPFVGRLEYQGYFKKELAIDYVHRLRAKGFDVFAGGVTAYSTLGWFDDPVLNTFVDEPEGELADLIFHELAHKRLFIPGDTDFNEAFATSVAREGVRRWFVHQNKPTELARYLANRQTEDRVIQLVLNYRDRLDVLYQAGDPIGPQALIARKEEILHELRSKYQALKAAEPNYRDYDEWMAAPINNAQLNTIDTYYQLVPGFEARLREFQGNLNAFYEDVAAMRRVDKDARRDLLAAAEARSTKPGVLPDEPKNGGVQKSAHAEDRPEHPFAGLVAKEKLSNPAAQESAH